MSIEKVTNQVQLIQYLKVQNSDISEEEVVIQRMVPNMNSPTLKIDYSDFKKEYREITLKDVPSLYFSESSGLFHQVNLKKGGIGYKRIHFSNRYEIWLENEFSEDLIEINLNNNLDIKNSLIVIDKTHKLFIASLPSITLDNSKIEIPYKPNVFSQINQGYSDELKYKDEDGNNWSFLDNLKLMPLSVEAVKRKFVLNYNESKKDWAKRFPLVIKNHGSIYPCKLTYLYHDIEKNPSNIAQLKKIKEQEWAIEVQFVSVMTLVAFLNKTIFPYVPETHYDDGGDREKFLLSISNIIDDIFMDSDIDYQFKIGLFYYLPPVLYKKIPLDLLWLLLIEILDQAVVSNWGRDDENIAIKLLEAIYSQYLNPDPVFADEIKPSQDPHKDFLKELVEKKVDGKPVLQSLIVSLDTKEFLELNAFLWGIWKQSSYASIDPTKNPLFANFEPGSSFAPEVIQYKSDKTAGFYSSNADIVWNENTQRIHVSLSIAVGQKKTKKIIPTHPVVSMNSTTPVYEDTIETLYQDINYRFHPLSPLIIKASDNEDFIIKENGSTSSAFIHLPAFVLFAHKESAFWNNVMKTGEYALDIATTFSGVGNLLKVGRLVRILNAGKTLLRTTKLGTQAIKTVYLVAGTIEVTSGTVNALIKIMDQEESPLSKAISKYLFWLEMITLSGEITVALRSALRKSAKEIVAKPENLKALHKKLDDLADNGKIETKQKKQVIEEIERSRVKKNLEELVNKEKAILKLEGDLWKSTNKFGTELQWKNQKQQEIFIKINKSIEKGKPAYKKLKEVNGDWGSLNKTQQDLLSNSLEAEVAKEFSKYDELTSFANDVFGKNSKGEFKEKLGDIDVGSTYHVEVKFNISGKGKSSKLSDQIKKYIDPNHEKYINVENKKVVLFIGQFTKGGHINQPVLQKLKAKGVIIVTDINQVKKLY